MAPIGISDNRPKYSGCNNSYIKELLFSLSCSKPTLNYRQPLASKPVTTRSSRSKMIPFYRSSRHYDLASTWINVEQLLTGRDEYENLPQHLTAVLPSKQPSLPAVGGGYGMGKHLSLSKSVCSRSCSGLLNIGNTCFMNSGLQCLAHTESLLEYCLESQYKADINREASRMKGLLMTAYAELMDLMWNGKDSVVSPTKFKGLVEQYAKRFVGYNQHDAPEFLLFLLQGLHEDVNRVRVKKKIQIDSSNEIETISASDKARKSWKEHLESENSKIVDLFEGQQKSSLTCTNCGYVSNTFDPVLGLSLPIKRCYGGSVSLTDCMELFTQEEILDGDNRMTCARCKLKQKATKRLSIQKFPQILIINLKRFQGQGAFRSKLSTEVKFPLRNLDLKTFSAESVAGSIVYDLYAVSNHSGTPSGGHYTAMARDLYTKDWKLFDDQRVSTISESDVVTSEAYILFYQLSCGSLAL